MLEDCVALIRSTASSLVDDGKKIIDLMHSDGRVVGPDALDELGVQARANTGVPGRVKRLVHMCAFIPQIGQYLAGVLGEKLSP